ncbi:hypothetical protein Niako_7062 [Niastella koreensis GR20-10]|uniref:Uncharacterized protein n=1 Tax=Niastella koreensis (strain DSM 17620 / KACC 11465 / NBRC 106392 / GR20-10) TaxID=700598 RepID=G8TRU8_NIAKG|nr:hypothetical protein Niako_7062 [Niastella koreensis GR20-10]
MLLRGQGFFLKADANVFLIWSAETYKVVSCCFKGSIINYQIS